MNANSLRCAFPSIVKLVATSFWALGKTSAGAMPRAVSAPRPNCREEGRVIFTQNA